MPHDDDTPDVEHLLFSDLSGERAEDASASAVPQGPLAIYMGCHPAAGRHGEPAECEEPVASTTGDEEPAGEWGGLTLEAPRRASMLAWTWLDPDDSDD
jgi:hypothetical protein